MARKQKFLKHSDISRYATLPSEILETPKLTPSEKLLWCKLFQHQGKNEFSWPSLTTLATSTALSLASVKNSLRRLEKLGFLERQRPSSKRGNASTRYRLLCHEVFQVGQKKAYQNLDTEPIQDGISHEVGQNVAKVGQNVAKVGQNLAEGRLKFSLKVGQNLATNTSVEKINEKITQHGELGHHHEHAGTEPSAGSVCVSNEFSDDNGNGKDDVPEHVLRYVDGLVEQRRATGDLRSEAGYRSALIAKWRNGTLDMSAEHGHQEDEQEPAKAVVDYLNSVAGTQFKHTTAKTKALVRARFNEGFTPEDFEAVINAKWREWRSGDMARYIRPETLFGDKFEGYLNEAQHAKRKETRRRRLN